MTTETTMAEKRTNRMFGVLLSGFMSIVFAGLFPLMALGPSVEWLMAWGTGVLVGWPLGIGLVTIASKPLRRLATRIVT